VGERRSGVAVLRLSTCLAITLCVGCGDALAPVGFRGEPLISVEGRIHDATFSNQRSDYRASVFWSLVGVTTTQAADLVEQSSIAVDVTFPSTFRINVFEPPPSLNQTRVSGDYEIGQLMIYEDQNFDGQFTPGELQGGAIRSALLYAQAEIPAPQSPTGRTLEAGFTLVNLPLSCDPSAGPSVPDPDPVTCGVDLGASCERDADCGGGSEAICLKNDGVLDYPGGYCTISGNEECAPSAGTLIYTPATKAELLGYWMKRCDNNGDCREDGYECVTYNGTCQPKEPVLLAIQPDFFYEPLCVDDTGFN
jgi:hypothetical protein